ncbi:MAG: fliF [Bacillales bacterium]|jgi:flagellar M-ring protein FliF|nr:fliF [Bacillales bacterium]
MNRSWTDQIKQKFELLGSYWKERTSKQKWLVIGTFLFLVIFLSVFIYFASRPQFVPLYSGQLSQQEVGNIKAELDKEGFTNYKISQNGTMLLVPQKDAPDLVVSLASKGYPKDNSINYDVFSSNLSFGATDRQYDILERQAMQTQVEDILKHVDGIKDANVILTLPSNSVFVSQDDQQKATASVMVKVAPGTQLSSGQIRALYTLVSHSVPNLPKQNITIMNQYSQELTMDNTEESDELNLNKYEQQQRVQQDVQRNIQQSLQSLLGTVLGTSNVYVQTFVKMNFDKIKTEEQLVKPTDKDNNGIVISKEDHTISSKGGEKTEGGVVGTGSEDVPPSYPADSPSEDTTYDESNSKVNYEVNRIKNEITRSPYVLEDITVNVGVQPDDPKSNKLSQETLDNIRSILSNTVRTALGHPELTESEIDQRITIFPQKFATNQFEESSGLQNSWYLIGSAIAGGILLLVGGLYWMTARRRRKEEEEIEDSFVSILPSSKQVNESDYFAEQEMTVDKQLEKLLNQRPEDFSKVIRTWLNEEEV